MVVDAGREGAGGATVVMMLRTGALPHGPREGVGDGEPPILWG